MGKESWTAMKAAYKDSSNGVSIEDVVSMVAMLAK